MNHNNFFKLLFTGRWAYNPGGGGGLYAEVYITFMFLAHVNVPLLVLLIFCSEVLGNPESKMANINFSNPDLTTTAVRHMMSSLCGPQWRNP